ncbi:M28 family peptidase [Jatrophihabitans lederbergiae]|uniref:M28 family peptidase n=1 Tax=Jatrophihabitans lederbergiae TaxID=3075547 RepID=UPI0037C01847
MGRRLSRHWNSTCPAAPGRRSKGFSSPSTLRGEPYNDTLFSGRSDYQAFIYSGIPSGGLFTGPRCTRPPSRRPWDGTADLAFDPCYHQACDTYANNDDHVLDVTPTRWPSPS